MARSRNFVASLVSVSFNSADTETGVLHGLVGIDGVGITPRGVIVCGKSADVNLYYSGTAWTSTLAYLKASGSCSMTLLFFV